MAPREGKQLAGQFCRAVDGVRNRLDITLSPLLAEIGPPQQIDRGADHGKQIVEIVRHPTGELPQRLQPLAVLQRFLGLYSSGGLDMQPPRPPQRERKNEKQKRGGRYAEDQMLAHGGEPARTDRRSLQARADINRIFGESLVAEAAFDAVDWRGDGDEPGPRACGDLLSDRPASIELDIAILHRETGQHGAVGQAEREKAAGVAADPGIEILKIFREDRGLDHAGKTAVVGLPPSADAEERGAPIGHARRQRLADENPDILSRMRVEIVPVGKLDVGRRRRQAVDEGAAAAIEDPCRFHLRQRLGEPL